ncbi:hypothetical protein [Saccharopolyspora taberi]|uniref:Uncharacterized protein n=1 Tax=Saccharopolyspora taberi TaxID=60895 RepID=A0ABN3V5W4_9PSEU
MPERRFLRPRLLAAVDGALWVVDEFQPVAALVEPGTGTVREVVDWRSLAPPEPGHSAEIVTDGSRIWVQQGSSVGWVDETGLRQAAEVGGTHLCAVGRGAAWCVDWHSPDPGRSPGPGIAPVPPPMPEGRLVIVAEDGPTRVIPVDRPAQHVEIRADGAYLEVHSEPPTATPVSSSGWTFTYHHDHLWFPAEVPDRIEFADHAKRDPGPGGLGWSGRGGAGSWLAWHSADEVTTDGLLASGLRWALGPLPEFAHGDRHPVVATGHDPDTGAERVRFELGTGRLHAAVECGGYLWAVLCPAPRPRDRPPLRLLRIDPGSGQVDQVAPVDITDRCWSPVSLPEDEIEAHANRERAVFDDVERYLRGVADARSEIDGRWPDLGVRLTFRHPYFPGGWLSRRWRVFDEIGRPVSHEYASVHLMEDLDTHHLPPVDAAEGGVLEI